MENLLKLSNINKRFPGVHALKDVQLALSPGKVHALMGENGAGKSTLIKIIAGVYDFEGEYEYLGERATFKTPAQAIEKGISVIYQELNLCLNMTVAENIFFNRWNEEGKKSYNAAALNKKAQLLLDDLKFDIRADALLERLSTAKRQLVEIARAVSMSAKIIIMDEPTSALAQSEIESLYEVIESLKAKNIAILYVSHKLNEIFRVADEVTVLRDGAYIDTKPITELDANALIKMMVGRPLDESYPKEPNKFGETVLTVQSLSSDKLKGVSFYVRSGEIVGFSGLMGSGRTELAKAIFGYDERQGGKVTIGERELMPNATWEAVARGIGYVPEDRKNEGIFNLLSVAENILISSQDDLSKNGVVQDAKQTVVVQKAVEALQIKTPSINQLVEKLSGGNQQKVILGRWFAKEGIKLLIVDEPTRGIDVGAKREIYTLLNEFAKQGMAIIIMSSEMPEVIGMCDRIYVISEGRITAELSGDEVTQQEILKHSVI